MKKQIILSMAIMASLGAMAQTDGWAKELRHRLLLDFNKSREEVKAYIRRYIPDVTDDRLDAWERTGVLECLTIDGEKRYFHNAAPNLFRVDEDCRHVKEIKDGPFSEGYEDVDRTHVPAIMRQARKATGWLAEPKRVRVTYTLTVKADAVPAGETVRCWLPFPRRDVNRQRDVRLIASTVSAHVSPPTDPHSALYMEQVARSGQPTVFQETFEYTAGGEYRGLKASDVKPYDRRSDVYRRFTGEDGRHVVFTPRLRQLADSLTRGVRNPYLKARRIFTYIAENYPWASAREYSTIENIPTYVVENRHGDCGQVTLLFMTLCRLSGIPTHWQSGFMTHPGHDNLHDWCEAYFEGVGWVPVDQSFGIPSYAKDDAERYFFLGGIDSWRMIVNNDYGQSFFPSGKDAEGKTINGQKKYPRSETVDFQRGEVEWSGGNLYFDQWSWNIAIDYLP
ncbi:transglutaminase domain-containing protein [Prevotella sp. A2931]|uniref:Transglutaminase domain-containing protein n=1 Tax=Prevotella illustrans TaxID=2800387 RepID=A0ABS3M251_9BACT|nr:transglutaminase domain-containing protein [Prevotella illustrans]PTL26510.1 cysteine protease [Prevotella sp. oral taxon 820]